MVPAVTGSGASASVIAMSAEGLPTVVACVAVLLPRFGSAVLVATVTVAFNTVPLGVFEGTAATIAALRALPAPGAVAAVQLQTTGFVPVQTPSTLGEAVTKVVPDGKVRLIDTAAAGLAPPFVAVAL